MPCRDERKCVKWRGREEIGKEERTEIRRE
jgi:hypothetical protein